MHIPCNSNFSKTIAGPKYSPIYATPSTIMYAETTAKDRQFITECTTCDFLSFS